MRGTPLYRGHTDEGDTTLQETHRRGGHHSTGDTQKRGEGHHPTGDTQMGGHHSTGDTQMRGTPLYRGHTDEGGGTPLYRGHTDERDTTLQGTHR